MTPMGSSNPTPGLPRYEQLRLELLRELAGFAPGDRFLTQRAIMARYQASLSTVEHALRELESAGRIERRRGSGTYVLDWQHAAVPGVPQSDTHSVALLMTRNVVCTPESFFGEILLAINERLSSLGYHFSYAYMEDYDNAEKLYAQMRRAGFLGCILIGQVPESLARSLHDRQFPAVSVDRSFDDPELCSIGTDNRTAGMMAVRHLLECGHRKIGFVSIPLHTSFLERYEGYCTAMAEAGIPLRREWLDTRFQPATVENTVRRLLDSPERPTALFAANDSIAANLLREFKRIGCRLPEEMSIIGLDDELFCVHTEPPLTTLAVPRAQMGILAVQELHRALSGQPIHSHSLDVKLVERASVFSK